ncbi:hypothetical protein QJ857_gp0253 [Tupanvirus soda lake]|uniref:Hedgehog/Intein (Hint) domain-containing protein n=2 Tax=Tupanvirus TaxID=2094720 RepID=A0A6N1P1T3_9VIRU|nr:hypothetical protein QJ857_gp0253 [Tupanvirus soda lake]QKU35772.1 hypothetical protein [Tupanvirus soda lake]
MSNIVVNGGFETGSLPPWVASLVQINTTNPHTGTFAAQFTIGSTTTTTLTQTLTTVPGATYTLSYWVTALAAGLTVGTFFVLWDGVIVPGSVVLTSEITSYTEYTFTVTAIDASTTLTFVTQLTSGLEMIRVWLDDVSVILQAICFSGESLVLAKNTKTGEIAEIEAKNIYSDIHEVYSVNDQKFVPVKLNIVTGPTDRYRLIKKGALGENQPSQDFFVTSGHKIVINGVETKARDIPQAKRIKVEPELVYSICTDKHEPILVNNLPVVSWGHKEWLISTKMKNIKWTNNNPKTQQPIGQDAKLISTDQ